MNELRLSFHGAARGVTGSCFRLETASGTILVDCGMFQGSKTEKNLNYKEFPFNPETVNAVVLTHAHIDHSGLLPKLVRQGFRGPIFATPPTIDLCEVMLKDSAHIQQYEVEHLNRKNAASHKPRISAIYDLVDAETCLSMFSPRGYGEWFSLTADTQARFWNAGHLLGSASVELKITHGSETISLLFSGDIGPDYKLLEPDPVSPTAMDYVICESTYGDRDREDVPIDARRELLKREVLAAVHPSGVLLIPSFAVERTQEVLLDLMHLMETGQIPRIPIHVDSPMATAATEVFAKFAHYLEGGKSFIKGLGSRLIHFTETVEQSKALDRQHGFHIVIAASGMCEAGRIRHRLKNWIWRDEATVLFVGYQATGTLGRILQDGAKKVRIQGQELVVRARIRSLELYSGHADGAGLEAWIKARHPISKALFLIHGEQDAIDGLEKRVTGCVKSDVIIPSIDETYGLTDRGAKLLHQGYTPRLSPQDIAHSDWHNERSQLIIQLNEVLDRENDPAERRRLIKALRQVMDKK